MNREIKNIFYNHIRLQNVKYNDNIQLKFEDCNNSISELNSNFPKQRYLLERFNNLYE